MRDVVLDVEADDLLLGATQIWVVCVRDIETDETESFRHAHEVVEWMHQQSPRKLIMHNGIGYDLPILWKLWDLEYTIGQQDTFCGCPVEIVDTLHLSQFLYPDRLNGHSLEAFGNLLGYPKSTFSDFSKYTQEMEDYCLQDTLVTKHTYNYLMEEVKRRSVT